MDRLCRDAHPNIIEIIQHGRLRENSVFYYIDMELCNFNLEEYIQGQRCAPRLLSWASVLQYGEGPFFTCFILQQIISGLKFIHDHNEVHRDLNPQNGKIPSISL
jgi:serine/threonine protein kinase